MFKRTLSGLFLVLGLWAIWLYAHEAYSSLKNNENKALYIQLSATDYDLNWPMNATDQWINGFGKGWRWQNKQLQIKPQEAAVSLRFDDRFIYPEVQGELRFDWRKINASINTSSQVLLEFSQADSGLFYYAPWLNVTEGENSVNLAEIKWRLKEAAQDKTTVTSWHQLPPLNTLVIRFRNQTAEDSPAILKNISIRQTSDYATANQPKALQQDFTNTLRHHFIQARQQQLQPLQMSLYTSLAPIVWWLAAVGFLLLSILVKGQTSATVRLQSGLLVLLVGGSVWLLQQTTLIIFLEKNSWLILLPMVTIVALTYRRWLRPKSWAVPICWLSFGVALGLWYVADFEIGFWQTLPLYVLWAFCQQVLIGPLVSDWLQKNLTAQTWFIACLVGALFAWLHSPNQMLMLATFVGGSFWSWAWLRYRNIYINSISHAIWALLFYQAMPDALLGTARIGLWF